MVLPKISKFAQKLQFSEIRIVIFFVIANLFSGNNFQSSVCIPGKTYTSRFDFSIKTHGLNSMLIFTFVSLRIDKEF